MSFVQATKEDFEAILPDNAVINNSNGSNEYIYDIEIGKGIALRVYSSIDVSTDKFRNVGSDAIRVAYLDLQSNRAIGKAKRTNRVEGWQDRLHSKIAKLLSKTPKVARCPKCKSVLLLRNSDRGEFYGCLSYPLCKFAVDKEKLKSSLGGKPKTKRPKAKVTTEEAAVAFSNALHEAIEVTPGKVTYHDADPNNWAPGDALDIYQIKYPTYNPCQSSVLPFATEDNNIVLAASTSAGKTEVAAILIAEALGRQKKALFASPLKAVTLQKYREWTSEEHPFSDYNISIVTGDFRLTKARKKELAGADVILLTSEMVDSKTRLFFSEMNFWLRKAGVLVYDEAHLITKQDRGDAVEVGLMRFTMLNPEARILFLSATMPNIVELGEWLSALNGKDSHVIKCDWRPCELELHFTGYMEQTGWGSYYANEQNKRDVACQIIGEHRKDPWIVFVHSKIAGHAITKALREMRMKVEFHRADLNADQKEKIEKMLDDGKINVIVSTPTLAWGVNLSARRVLILGIHRGIKVIDDLGIEINQMAGRAGRVGLQPKGDSYILLPACHNLADDNDPVLSEYKNQITTVNPITSKLLDEDTLCFHIVAEIAQGGIDKLEDVEKWYRRSFSAKLCPLDENYIRELVEKMISRGILRSEDDKISATLTGKVASWLYYNPFNVADWAGNFKRLFSRGRETDDRCIAWALANVHSERKREYINKELQPISSEIELNIRTKLFDGQWISIGTCGHLAALYYFILSNQRLPDAVKGEARAYQFDSERAVAALKILDKYVVKQGGNPYWDALAMRIKYGVGWEETDLMQAEGIGPARARNLVDGGIRSIGMFFSQSRRAASLIGKKSWQKAAKSFKAKGLV